MANSSTTTDSLIKMVLIVGTRLTTVRYALAKKKMSGNSVHFGEVFGVLC